MIRAHVFYDDAGAEYRMFFKDKRLHVVRDLEMIKLIEKMESIDDVQFLGDEKKTSAGQPYFLITDYYNV